MLLSNSLLLALFTTFTFAQDIKKNQYCFDTCYEAYGYTLFAGDNPELYYYSACQYPPKVLSIYAAATVYCTPSEIEAGIPKLQGYCKEYGPDLELLPISDFAANLTDAAIKKLPIVSYDEAVAAAEPYNHSVIISQSFFDIMYKTVDVWEYELWTHSTYGFAMYGFWGALLLIGMVTNAYDVFVARRFERYQVDSESNSPPIPRAESRIRRYWNWFDRNIVLAFTFGNHHQRKLWGCTIPTRMVSIVVGIYWILNLILCAVNIDAFAGNLYYPENSLQVWRYLADRTGIVCFANLPLLWMFAGRNNIFLWATGWKFSTFNIYHRNIARIATIEAIVHSAAYTALYLKEGKATYYLEFEELWFVMGVVGTVLMSCILLFSSVIVRKMAYEVFLILHILMSIAVIIALFYHVSIFEGRYDAYLWALVAIWPFDRLLRIVRLVYCNIRVKLSDKSIDKTNATAVYDDASGVITLHVAPGSSTLTPHPGQHYFIYTPRSWKCWESHPFTLGAWTSQDTPTSKIVNRSDAKQANNSIVTSSREIKSETGSNSSALTPTKSDNQKTELVFWIRAFDGFTKRLAKSCKNSQHGTASVPILLEGPYGHFEPLHHFESVLLIGGGTGISGVYPYLQEHLHRLRSNKPTRTRTVQLIVAARQATFFQQLSEELLQPCPEGSGAQIELFATRDDKKHVKEVLELDSPVSVSSDGAVLKDIAPDGKDSSSSSTRDADSHIHIGRPDVEASILNFARANHADGRNEKTAVLVCGPGGMADEARAAVLRAGREGMNVEYFEDAFGW